MEKEIKNFETKKEELELELQKFLANGDYMNANRIIRKLVECENNIRVLKNINK